MVREIHALQRKSDFLCGSTVSHRENIAAGRRRPTPYDHHSVLGGSAEIPNGMDQPKRYRLTENRDRTMKALIQHGGH